MQRRILTQAVAGALAGAMTLDHASGMLTFDSMSPVMDHSPLWGANPQNRAQYPVAPGSPLGYGPSGSRGGVNYMTSDGQMITLDSTGAFLVGELERLDQTMHEPLYMTSWARDIILREDVTIADEVSSFTLTTFGSQGALGTGNTIGNGKAWMGKNTSQISGVGVDISKVPHALTPWALELKYDILELESAAKVGRPVDEQKYRGIMMKHDMDVDEQVYIGDTTLGQTGLLNDAGVTPVAVANGAAGSPLWTAKTPDEILTDFNEILTSTWEATGWKVIPDQVGLPPKDYGYISTQKVSLAGTESILGYIERNNLFAREARGKLNIVPMKYCNGAGAGGTIGTGSAGHDRMVAYSKNKEHVRYPMTLLQRTPIQFDGLYHKTVYFCRLGQLELVYPETMAYRDGLS